MPSKLLLQRAYLTRLLFALPIVLVVMALLPQAAWAHPMGNFSVNRYSRLAIGDESVALLYIVDMAEIPTHSERTAMDTDGDGVISAQEAESYVAAVAATLPAGLTLLVNGQAVAWTLATHTIDFPPGQADLPTLRMEFTLAAQLPATGDTQELTYTDSNYADRLGWQEIIVAPTDRVEILASDVPQSDLSQMLQAYPVDLLQNPPAVTSATVRWQPTTGATTTDGEPRAANANLGATTAALGSDPFAELIAIELGPWAVAVALLAAFGWGAAHALSPGHGKTIVAAYLVGTRGTFAHALFLGATTTITHTVGVFVLGLATLVASQYILPERIYPWLSTISGILVISIGVSIGWNRLRGVLRGTPADHHHDHAHDHTHDHLHDHSHTHSHGGHTHSHLPPSTNGGAITWRGLLALGISGGLLPCPSALVVLLGAIALGRVGFGLLLILMFSLGLATVLTLFGLLLLRAGKLFERIPESGRYAGYLAVASAAFITLVGAGITVRALMETGLFAGWV